jgi:RNA polymerase sigma-70 factor (ECF subfamily)
MKRPRIPRAVAAKVARLMVEESAALFRYALRITNGHQQEAEDLVQEAFQAAALSWAKIHKLSRDAQQGWLRTVVKKRAIDRWRITQRTQPVADIPDERQSPSAERVALSQMALDRCLQAIQKMPPAQHRVAYLRWHEDWSTKEIARELGIAQATVRVHLMNARKDLVDAVGNEIVLAEERDDEDDSRGKEA